MKMRKLFAVVLVVALMLCAFAGCGGGEGGEGQEEKTTFTIGFDQNFPPMGFVGEDGEFTGFDLELAAEVAARNDWEIVYRPIEWDAKDMELSSGTIDCVWNGFTMNGREDKYTFSKPYMENSQIFVVKKSSGITDFASLAGKVVCVQKDSAALSALNEDANAALKASFKDLVELADYNTAFMDLEAGAVEVIGMDIVVAAYQIRDKQDEYMILEQPLQAEQYGVGFLLGNEELRDTVQATLDAMQEDGKFAEISNKWFGRDVSIAK